MIKGSEGGTAFPVSIGLAFVGGYADAASFLLAQTFTGHLTGNCVLAAVSAASSDWTLAVNRLLAAGFFTAGILASLTLSQFIPHKWKRYSLAISLCTEVLLIVIASLFLANPAYKVGFIICMCLALSEQVRLSQIKDLVAPTVQDSFGHPQTEPERLLQFNGRWH